MTSVQASPPRVAAASAVLTGAATFWFIVALIGQWAFFYYIAAFYGPSALSGNYQAWNRLVVLGARAPFVAGDAAGNLTFLAHALAAGYIAFGGALQLVPQVRARAPVFHRWNGRLFLLTVVSLSLSGFYLVWARNKSPDGFSALSTTLNGGLILTFAALALRSALARDFVVHRRWALRLYLVSNAQWFLRIGVFAYFIINHSLGRKIGLGDPVLLAWTPGCYLVPLAVLELYLRAKAGAGPGGRLVMAGSLVVLTLLMGVGIAGFSFFSQVIISGGPMAFPK